MWLLRPNINKLKIKKNIPGLIKCLYHKDGILRKDAAIALGSLVDPNVIFPIAKALNENRISIDDSVQAFCPFGKSLINPIIDAQESYKIPWNVISELLVKLANNFEISAIDLLLKAAIKKKIPELTLRNYLIAVGEPSVCFLIDHLNDHSHKVQQIAVLFLGNLGNKKAIEPLIKKLKSKSIRYEAAISLAKLGDASAVEPLAELMSIQNGAFDLKTEVAEALSFINDTSAMRPLKIALQNFEKDKELRKIAWDEMDNYKWHPGDDGFAEACWGAQFSDSCDHYEYSLIKNLAIISSGKRKDELNKSSISIEVAEYVIQQFKKKLFNKERSVRIFQEIADPALEVLKKESNCKDKRIKGLTLSFVKELKERYPDYRRTDFSEYLK